MAKHSGNWFAIDFALTREISKFDRVLAGVNLLDGHRSKNNIGYTTCRGTMKPFQQVLIDTT